MKKALEKFDEVWAAAQAVNARSGKQRFFRLFESYRRKYLVIGLYDTVTKKYALFDTVNLTGNYRYNNRDVPAEVYEMEAMVKG